MLQARLCKNLNYRQIVHFNRESLEAGDDFDIEFRLKQEDRQSILQIDEIPLKDG